MDNPVLALMNNDPNAFREGVTNMLMTKLADRIDLARVDAASKLFGVSADATNTEGEPANV